MLGAHWERLWAEREGAWPRVAEWLSDHTMYDRQVLGTWGMIAKGAQAIPYALGLLKHPDPEVRACGAAVLGGIGRQDGVVDALLAAAEEAFAVAEPERETQELIGSLLYALGALKCRRAVPLLARVVRDEAVDPETRWSAAEGLGQIVGRRFAAPDSIEPALAWLTRHGY